MRRKLNQFSRPVSAVKQRGQGGSDPKVQNTSEILALDESKPMLAVRIYAPSSIKHYDDSDPRFEGKANSVENIYHPAQEMPPPRSGIMQALNWLFQGRMA